jgi:hypothetical protein
MPWIMVVPEHNAPGTSVVLARYPVFRPNGGGIRLTFLFTYH